MISGCKPEGLPAGPASAAPAKVSFLSTPEVLRQPAFWIVSVCLALFLGAYSGMLFSVPKFAGDLGADAMARSNVTIALTVSGLIGKLVFGWAADRIPLKVGLWTAIGLTVGSVSLMTSEPEYPVLLAQRVRDGPRCRRYPAGLGCLDGGDLRGRELRTGDGAAGADHLAGGDGGLRDRRQRVTMTTGSFVLAFQIFAGVLCLAILVLFALRMPAARRAGPTSPEPEAARA